MGRVRLKIWRFVCIYLTAITLSLTFSHLLLMPQKFKYDQGAGAEAQFCAHAGGDDLCSCGAGSVVCNGGAGNTQMAQGTTVPLPESWMDTRWHWEFGHASSAVLDLIGFGALIASVLLDGMAEIANG